MGLCGVQCREECRDRSGECGSGGGSVVVLSDEVGEGPSAVVGFLTDIRIRTRTKLYYGALKPC